MFGGKGRWKNRTHDIGLHIRATWQRKHHQKNTTTTTTNTTPTPTIESARTHLQSLFGGGKICKLQHNTKCIAALL